MERLCLKRFTGIQFPDPRRPPSFATGDALGSFLRNLFQEPPVIHVKKGGRESRCLAGSMGDKDKLQISPPKPRGLFRVFRLVHT